MPLAPRSNRDTSATLAPGPDQPGVASNSENARAPVQNRAQRRRAETQVRANDLGTHATGQNFVQAQQNAGQVAGIPIPARTDNATPEEVPQRGPVGEPLAAPPAEPPRGDIPRSSHDVGQLAQLRAALAAYQAAFEAAGLKPPVLPSGNTTEYPTVGHTRGGVLMRAKEADHAGSGALGLGNHRGHDNVQISQTTMMGDASRTERSATGAPGSAPKEVSGTQAPRSEEIGGLGDGGTST